MTDVPAHSHNWNQCSEMQSASAELWAKLQSKSASFLSKALFAISLSLVLDRTEYFQKCAWIIWFVCNPHCLENIKTAKYTSTRTKQTVNVENRFAVWVWGGKQAWILPSFWRKFSSWFKYETHQICTLPQWAWFIVAHLKCFGEVHCTLKDGSSVPPAPTASPCSPSTRFINSHTDADCPCYCNPDVLLTMLQTLGGQNKYLSSF